MAVAAADAEAFADASAATVALIRLLRTTSKRAVAIAKAVEFPAYLLLTVSAA